MYSKLLNVRILVALLKKHGVRHIVLSAGTRQVPLARCVEADPFFTTHSVVDERSAAYFAIGLMKGLGEPVGIACTSSTATCNYLPAVAEARYLGLPLVVMTGDRDARLLDQLEDQMIPQPGMYTSFCKRVVDLPPLPDKAPADDVWYCSRLVNEALLAARRGVPGPVQINFRVVAPIGDIADAGAESLPYVPAIRLVEPDDEAAWREAAGRLRAARRVLVLAGQTHGPDPELAVAVDAFAARFDCLVAVENVSNLPAASARHTFLAVQALPPKPFRSRLPEIVVSFGGNFSSAWKPQLRVNAGAFEHWLVDPEGAVRDGFKSLRSVFACRPAAFFRRMAELAGPDARSEGSYDALWRETAERAPLPALPWSNALAITRTVRALPEGSLLHTGILHSTRLMECQPVPAGVRVHSNIGTHGIDGTLSTFLGEAAARRDVPAYLVLGDLSFFYDMGAVRIRDVGPNVHILLVNNGGGAEFHFTMGVERIPNIADSISAGHHATARAWVESQGFGYLSASDEASFGVALPEFLRTDHGRPVLLEVFTDKQSDGVAVRNLFAEVRRAFDSEAPAADKAVAAIAGRAPKTMEAASRVKSALFGLFGKKER